MRQFTKDLKEARQKDMTPIYTRNNSQWAKDPRVAAQAHLLRLYSLAIKWEVFLEDAETPAQKAICKDVLDRIVMMGKEHEERYCRLTGEVKTR